MATGHEHVTEFSRCACDLRQRVFVTALPASVHCRDAGRNQSASDGFHESALARLGPDDADVERTSSRVAPLFDQTTLRIWTRSEEASRQVS